MERNEVAKVLPEAIRSKLHQLSSQEREKLLKDLLDPTNCLNYFSEEHKILFKVAWYDPYSLFLFSSIHAYFKYRCLLKQVPDLLYLMNWLINL